MAKYDYLIVGAGLFGATVAYRAKQAGKNVLVIDKRDHIAGNVYTETIELMFINMGPISFIRTTKMCGSL